MARSLQPSYTVDTIQTSIIYTFLARNQAAMFPNENKLGHTQIIASWGSQDELPRLLGTLP